MKNNIVILIAILFLCSFSSLWAEEERRELIFSTLDEVEKEITSQTACVNRDYQQRAISISQALKEAEKLLTEKSLEQPAALTKAKIEPSQPSPSQNFFSDFYLYSPLLTLINNWAGLSPLYFYDSDDFTWNWKKYFGEGAEYVYATLGLQSGYITGDTTYHITFAEDVLGFVFSGESELEFPLDNFLLGVEGVLGYKDFRNDKRDKARLSVSWFTDVSSDAGKMQDSDWLNNNYDILYTGSTHPGLDIYSESDTDLDTN
ncbi:MAG: hypothetical protein ISS43_02895, partial [Candidatus Omnitrophica bacterium]|nr:hypothetical protein [Candidatus Omnitrophota bacterium]